MYYTPTHNSGSHRQKKNNRYVRPSILNTLSTLSIPPQRHRDTLENTTKSTHRTLLSRSNRLSTPWKTVRRDQNGVPTIITTTFTNGHRIAVFSHRLPGPRGPSKDHAGGWTDSDRAQSVAQTKIIIIISHTSYVVRGRGVPTVLLQNQQNRVNALFCSSRRRV